jgi:protein-disulfide isomerase
MSFKSSLLLAFSIALPYTAHAQAPAAITRDQVPSLVREALMNDPTIVVDAMKKYRENQEVAAKKAFKENLVKTNNEIFHSPDSPVLGDEKNADIRIVEFFDYHCGYCKRLLPDLNKLVAEDKKVVIVFKEFPILSEDSITASRAALAVHRIAKDKYFAFHSELMKASGKFDEPRLLDIAKKLGISPDKLKAEMAKPEITAILDKNRETASLLRIEGTPAMIIGSELLAGAAPYEEMKKLVDAARKEKAALAQ